MFRKSFKKYQKEYPDFFLCPTRISDYAWFLVHGENISYLDVFCHLQNLSLCPMHIFRMLLTVENMDH